MYTLIFKIKIRTFIPAPVWGEAPLILNHEKYTALLLLIIHLILGISSCTKDKINANEDLELFEDIIEGGYHYYQNGNKLNGVAPSPHGAFKLRFNEIAFAALDSSANFHWELSFPMVH